MRLPPHLGAAVAICLIAVLAMGLGLQYPPDMLSMASMPHTLAVHMVFELFSILVSALVVVIAWQTLDHKHSSVANVLIFGFVIVAGSDFMHLLTHEGMPTFMGENSTSKAIYYWLSARYVELLVMLVIAAQVTLPGPRRVWFLAGVLILQGIIYAGTAHIDHLPVTFVPGQGVTPLKTTLEYLLCAGNLAVSFWLFVRCWRSGSRQGINYAVASFIMGVGELAFTNYRASSDFINILGHFYKVAAYCFIFRAAFLSGVRQPYEKLAESEAQLAAKTKELETLLSNLPLAVIRVGRDMQIRYLNKIHDRPEAEDVSQTLSKRVASFRRFANNADFPTRVEQVLNGEKVAFEFNFQNEDGEHCYRSVSLVPERGGTGEVQGILAIVSDTSERVRAQNLLMQSQSEIVGLKAALDAHAIVGVTDAQGVMTEVNDKFCEISGYSRKELVGHTHEVILSGQHPPSYYDEITEAVARGDVWNGENCYRAKDGSIFWTYTTIVPFMDDAGNLTQFFAIGADITKRKQAERDVEHMAFHDALTGLPNRRLMSDRLGHAALRASRNGSYGAVLLLDIDHFKEINDTLGHALGDELLKLVAARLCESLRTSDTVARLGGDEFVIILEDIGENAEAATDHADSVCEKLRMALATPFTLADHEVSGTLSIGVVLFHVAQDHPDELLKQADIALYKAKEEGRNRVRYFDPSLQADVTARAALLRDLRQALGQDQLCLHYQPIVDADRRILGVEALLRWQHPSRGLVSPDIFIPIAEQSNLIAPIGQWVLESACAQLRQWADDPGRADWTIAVNVSARQFNEPEFVANVERALAKTGANPSLLCLELTESILHNDLGVTQSKMAMLRDKGVRFSLDDFGTGYSSLSYLQQLPLDQLKIDKSFVDNALSDPNSAEIVAIILSLARNLDLRVVAEGVETAAQFAFLVGHHCHAFQGYLFSRPVPVENIPSAVPAV